MNQEFILNFSQISAEDLPRVGGKGANLGELSRNGFPVPAGFCVNVNGFDAFISAAEEMDTHYYQLSQLEPDDVKGLGR